VKLFRDSPSVSKLMKGTLEKLQLFLSFEEVFMNLEDCMAIQPQVCARQETLNTRMKKCSFLSMKIQHTVNNYGNLFWAVAVFTEDSFENGEDLFAVECNDDP
jgi:hypothetical protein